MSDEKTKPAPDELAIWRERLLLAIQGIGVSLEKLADKPPIEITIPGKDDEQ